MGMDTASEAPIKLCTSKDAGQTMFYRQWAKTNQQFDVVLAEKSFKAVIGEPAAGESGDDQDQAEGEKATGGGSEGASQDVSTGM